MTTLEQLQSMYQPFYYGKKKDLTGETAESLVDEAVTQSYASNIWLTFAQAKQANLKVPKGSKAVDLSYEKRGKKIRWYVFNLDQLTGDKTGIKGNENPIDDEIVMDMLGLDFIEKPKTHEAPEEAQNITAEVLKNATAAPKKKAEKPKNYTEKEGLKLFTDEQLFNEYGRKAKVAKSFMFPYARREWYGKAGQKRRITVNGRANAVAVEQLHNYLKKHDMEYTYENGITAIK